jgi:nitrite reductase/ring-hydroxylating ferredoxin subunit
MAERYRLCRRLALPDPGSRGFSLMHEEETLELFVVRCGEEVRAYRNACPHTGVNLQWQADQFLDPSERYIQCATHGALFRIEDGFCLRGPCAGRSLQPLVLEEEDGWLILMT